MTAVLLALSAAFAYGLGDFCGGVGARRTSAWSVAFVAQLVGSVGLLAVALVLGGDPTTADHAWGVAAGVANGVGTAFLYRGLASGRMGVVAPLSGVSAALIPIVVGFALGERPTALAWVGMAVAVPAIWLVSREPVDSETVTESTGTAVVDGLLAGTGFGLLFVFLSRIGEDAGLLPLALNQAVAGLAIVAVAQIVGSAWIPRDAASLFGVVAGTLATAATVAFLFATHSGMLSITAVITSLYPAVTVLLAMSVLREHVHRGQAYGLLLCALCVGLVASAPSAAPAVEDPPQTTSPARASTQAAPEKSPTPPPRITLRVVGDIMLGRGVAAVSGDDPVAALRPMARHLRSADLTIGNLESTLSTRGTPTQGGDSFAVPASAIDGLADVGIDVVSLANNHTGDYGRRALMDTVDAFDKGPVRAFGAGRDLRSASRPVIVTVKGVRVGITGFNAIGETPRATANSPGALSVRMPPRTGPLHRGDLRHMVRLVRRLDRRADIVLVLPHWGTQYTHSAEPIQRVVGRRLIAAGADLVVGGHPHWVQGIESSGHAVLAHSLGNLVFDMDFMSQTMEGITLTATFTGARLRGVRLTPYLLDERFAPRIATGPDRARILGDVRRHSRGWFATGAGLR
ncbi:MAG: CapA family protein [Nocardioides sp.]|jgi:poly-gamma-glutamate capsule biosynthesis protein CapA/YwtB (metallophosphatase superfamily)/uncharacterized membrane protein